MRKQEELSLSLRFELWILWDRICVEHFGRARAPVVGWVKTDDLASVGAALALWLWGGWIFTGLALKGHPFFVEYLEPYFTIGWLVALAAGLGSVLFREKDPMGEKLLAQITKCQRYNADLRLLGTAFNVDLSNGLYRELNGWPVEGTKRPPPRYPSGSKSRCASELMPVISASEVTPVITIRDYNSTLTREFYNPHTIAPEQIGLGKQRRCKYFRIISLSSNISLDRGSSFRAVLR